MNKRLNYKVSPHTDKIILLLCLFLTIVSWVISVYVNLGNQRTLFELESQEIKESLNLHIENHLETLHAIRGLFYSSNNVTREEFTTFVKNLDLEAKDREFVRLSFVNTVEISDITSFDNLIVEEGYPGYKSDIANGQDQQYIVNYVTDSVGNNYPPMGINLWSGPERIEAINYAVKNHTSSITSVIDIRNVSEDSSKGIIIIVPVYKDSRLLGLLNGVINTKLLGQHFEEYLEDSGQIKLFDDKTIIFDVGKLKNIDFRNVSIKYNLSFFNKENYQLEIIKPQTNVFLLPISNFILVSGIIISILIYIVFYSIIRMNKQAYDLALEMTADLNKYKLAIDNTDNHIIITDIDGKVVYANKAASLLTGYSQLEIVGKTPSLWGKQMSIDFYKKLWHTIKVERKIFKGEIKNKKKNGQLYIALANISPIIDDNNDLVGFVGIEEDVTADKKATDDLKKMNDLMVGRELKMIELKRQLENRTV